MFELVGQDPCLFYVHRKGLGEPGEIWELTLATDQDNVQYPQGEKLQKTLGLVASCYKMDSAVYGCCPLVCYHGYGDKPMASFLAAFVCCPIITQCRIPRKALTRLSSMPVCGDYVPPKISCKLGKRFLRRLSRIARPFACL